MRKTTLKCCVLLVSMCSLLSSCKINATKEETTDSEIVNSDKADPFDGSFSSDVLADDSSMPQHGRIYLNPQYYREENGQKYIAVNKTTGVFIMDDPAGALSEGEQMRVDRDLTITVDRVEYDPEWEDPFCPEAGLTLEGTTFYRNKGKIKINKDFYFVHPSRIVYADGTVEADIAPDKWVLSQYESGFDDGSCPNDVTTYDSCKWVKVSDDCKVIFIVNNVEQPPQSISDLLESMNQYAKEDQAYFLASLAYRGDSIAKITILVE